MHPRIRVLVTLVGVFSLGAAGAIVSTAARAPVAAAAQTTITASLVQGFSPRSVDLQTGDTATWVNAEPLDYPFVSGQHNVVSDDGTLYSPDLAPGERWSFRFLKPGTYTYHCTIHPLLLQGTIVATGDEIVPPPTEKQVAIVEPTPDESTWGYSPKDVVSVVGTTVTWTNTSGDEHTVTADDRSFNSGPIAPHATFVRTFNTVATIGYHCNFHSTMQGTLHINSS